MTRIDSSLATPPQLRSIPSRVSMIGKRGLWRQRLIKRLRAILAGGGSGLSLRSTCVRVELNSKQAARHSRQGPSRWFERRFKEIKAWFLCNTVANDSAPLLGLQLQVEESRIRLQRDRQVRGSGIFNLIAGQVEAGNRAV